MLSFSKEKTHNILQRYCKSDELQNKLTLFIFICWQIWYIKIKVLPLHTKLRSSPRISATIKKIKWQTMTYGLCN